MQQLCAYFLNFLNLRGDNSIILSFKKGASGNIQQINHFRLLKTTVTVRFKEQ
jgi:hypothetical protein